MNILGPTQRGFDRFYGFMDGAMNHWEHFLTEDNRHIPTPDTPGFVQGVPLTTST